MKKLIIAVAIFMAIPIFAKASEVGVVADTHIGNGVAGVSERIKGFSSDRMWIVLGDNSWDNKEYCKEVKSIWQGKNVLFAKGNHDKSGCMEILETPRYYYKDIERTRFIVVDLSEKYNAKKKKYGGTGSAQLKWFKNALKTEKRIIVVSHFPLYKNNDYTKAMKKYYKQIDYVFSGHIHQNTGCIMNNKMKFCKVRSFFQYGDIFNFNF